MYRMQELLQSELLDSLYRAFKAADKGVTAEERYRILIILCMRYRSTAA